MKTKILLIFALVAGSIQLNAQTPWYLGGNNVPAFFFFQRIGIINNQPFRLITNNRQRMLIRPGGINNNTGRIAMGNNLPNNFIPRSRLHLHQRGGVTDIRFTNNGTGSLANDGFTVGIN